MLMDLDSIECVSSSDGMDEDEIHPHHHSEFSSIKPRNGGANNNNSVGPTAIAPATSVHELLECPVCTNSMYPPIHQVCSFTNFYLICIVSYMISFVNFNGSGVGLIPFAEPDFEFLLLAFSVGLGDEDTLDLVLEFGFSLQEESIVIVNQGACLVLIGNLELVTLE